ncbi:MAG: tRNA (N6-threonylcarbamoyladenosine(37)-N6)-methyltransferase TrmO [Peptostreptococcaceae bacterium]|jgi:tRNA-Thr(GGU) m(6)t(6)A37 methyltransferase TsaA|nr:tRNA (N6-threonylcarbamoyladenosine(37)-N6)-methyltransferase TrmO [Peptostreptococcaceae bacterium]
MEKIIIEPIGVIKSPFKEVKDIPPQSIFADEKVAIIEIDKKYQDGLKDLEACSHIVIQFYFHKSTGYKLITKTPWGDEKKGVFSTRSPNRPNHLGITIAKLLRVEDGKIEIKGVDMLDKTPIIDIKPYVKELNPKL